jgi:hypothetical protein
VNLGLRSAAAMVLIFDRFTQLDFFPGQIVVVQLTSLDRLHYCGTESTVYRKIMYCTHPADAILGRSLVDVYHKDFLFHELLSKVRAMVAIARAKKLKMVFWLSRVQRSRLDIF